MVNSMARRMFELVEPIGVIPYSADEPNEALFALGFTNYWDTYFAGRAAPLGVTSAEVVDAVFYILRTGCQWRTRSSVRRLIQVTNVVSSTMPGTSSAVERATAA